MSCFVDLNGFMPCYGFMPCFLPLGTEEGFSLLSNTCNFPANQVEAQILIAEHLSILKPLSRKPCAS